MSKQHIETDHLNLIPLEQVRKWDTKRVLSYKTRVLKHSSYIKNNMYYDDEFEQDSPEIDRKKKNLEKLDNYIKEIKKILATRENIN